MCDLQDLKLILGKVAEVAILFDDDGIYLRLHGGGASRLDGSQQHLPST